MADLRKLTGEPLDVSGRDIPSAIEINGSAAMADNRITVSDLRLGAGSSQLEATGTLKDPKGNGSLKFNVTLALDELGRIAKLDARPGGTVLANGMAKLDAGNNYRVEGQIEGRNLAFTQGGQRIRNVSVRSAVMLDSRRLELDDVQLSAFGGQFDGNASLEEFAGYSVREFYGASICTPRSRPPGRSRCLTMVRSPGRSMCTAI